MPISQPTRKNRPNPNPTIKGVSQALRRAWLSMVALTEVSDIRQTKFYAMKSHASFLINHLTYKNGLSLRAWTLRSVELAGE